MSLLKAFIGIGVAGLLGFTIGYILKKKKIIK